MRINPFVLGAAFSLVISACSGGSGAAAHSPRSAQDAAQPGRGQAFGLVMKTASCWMGGEWADALGEKYDARTAGIEARCNDVLRAMDTTPEESYTLLRSIDPKFVSRIATTVAELARRDPADAPNASELVLLLNRVANASRETMRARNAADQVKQDAAQNPAPASYAMDKNAAAPILSEGSAMGVLYADHGPYASEAHTIGLLMAMDRMEIGRGLPKHLKIDALRAAYVLVFGVGAPVLAGQGADRAPPGVWLGYVSEVAKLAQHPVPADVKALPDRETLAWAGVLEGFADKLRSEPAYAAPQTPLGQVVRGVVARLDDEFETARALQRPVARLISLAQRGTRF